MPISQIMKVLLLSSVIGMAAGHASLIMPPSRNNIDSETPAWSHGKHPMTGWIQPYNCRCTNGTEAECNSGQGCFWFSQGAGTEGGGRRCCPSLTDLSVRAAGCTIGCKECDGQGARIPKWDHCPMDSIKPTVNDPIYRSMNQNATVGSPEDMCGHILLISTICCDH